MSIGGAEAFLGRPLEEWTADDLGRLKAWLRPKVVPFAATITAVRKAPTLSNGKRWYSIGYSVDGKHLACSTFSENDADLARSCKSRKELAVLSLAPNRVHLKSIDPVTTPK